MRSLLCSLLLCLVFSNVAYAHFGLVLPSESTVGDKAKAKMSFLLAFCHPMEQNAMTLEKPQSFVVSVDGKKEDLTKGLVETTFLGHKAWKTEYTVAKPGVYQFAMTPKPYFEPAEDCFIVHYTKVILPAFGEEEDWDKAMGLPTEIVPLTRPFGNYAGNVFQGLVLLNGKPAPNCDVEVEYFNGGKKRTAPTDYAVTQVVKTDSNGVFTYAVPWAGWWGFAALNTAKEKMDYKGQAKEVELGAVLWSEFSPVK